MELFSAEFRRDYENDSPTDIERCMKRLDARKLQVSDGFELSPVSSLPSKVQDVIQFGIRRTLDMANSTIADVNRSGVIGACVLARGAFETACLSSDLVSRVQKYIDDPTGEHASRISQHIHRTLMGHGRKAKTFVVWEEQEAVNILTAIGNVAKEFGTQVDGFYEGLSEYSHPNSHGMVLLYCKAHKGGITTYTDQNDGRAGLATKLAVTALGFSLGLMELSAERWKDLARPFAELSEKHIHEAGTWPAEQEYPVNRETT